MYGETRATIQVILNNSVQCDQSSKYIENKVGTGQKNTLNAKPKEYEINYINTEQLHSVVPSLYIWTEKKKNSLHLPYKRDRMSQYLSPFSLGYYMRTTRKMRKNNMADSLHMSKTQRQR